MIDPRKYGYKRIETDIEFRLRIIAAWVARGGKISDNYGIQVSAAKDEELDKKGWELRMQRKIIDVY